MQANKNCEIVTIAGNRPEIIKMSNIIKDLYRYEHAFLYTGQHYSENMKKVFFEEFSLNLDYDLACNTSEIEILQYKIHDLLYSLNPSFVIVYGDTNTSLAGALAAKRAKCKVIHIEAGLRSFDLNMSEERNRVTIDSISDYLFAPTELAKMFLKYENIQENVFNTGNLVVDVCKRYSKGEHLEILDKYPDNYILLTVHRAETVDNMEALTTLVFHLAQIKRDIIFPIHPRTKKNLENFNIRLPLNVTVIEPVGYVEFLALLKGCSYVLTDSGGVQEEALILKKPCITLRSTTERQETLLLRANRLYPLSVKNTESLADIVDQYKCPNVWLNPYGEDVTKNTLKAINSIINNERNS